MTDLELNKRLHEILGLCWHEHKTPMLDNIKLSVDYGCAKCGVGFIQNLDFLTWEGFGILKEWLETHKGHEVSRHWCNKKVTNSSYDEGIKQINKLNYPRALAEAVVEFFKETK